MATRSNALKRDRAWIVEDAVRRYIQEESQLLAAVATGLAAIDAGQFVTHEAIDAALDQIDAELGIQP